MRVALVAGRADLHDGGQRGLVDLAIGLRAANIEPLAVLPEAGPLAAALRCHGIECAFVLLPRAGPGTFFRGARALRGLTALLHERDIDLLHSDSPRTGLYAGLAACLARRAHVWQLRASRPPSAAFDRLLLGLCDAAIAASRDTATRSFALRGSRKVRVVPTGLPPIDFLDRDAARKSLVLPREPFIAGVIGRVEPDKGGDDAVTALPAIRAAAPGALLAFLGSADPEAAWQHTCRLRAAAIGLSSAVLFLGERPDAVRLLRAFDMILHPSRREGIPRFILAALFAGVPTVAYAVGGIPEIIESGVSGLLVPPRAPGSFALAAAALAADPVLQGSLAARGLDRARDAFRLETMIEGVAATYDAVLRAAPVQSAPPGARAEARERR
jgi:glycosyltransferase involved in cell wall biosynthesis